MASSSSEGVYPPLHVRRGRYKVSVEVDRAGTAAAAADNPRRAEQRLRRDAVVGALLQTVRHETTQVPGEVRGV